MWISVDKAEVVVWAGPSISDWLAAAALVISIIVAAREFSARPRLMAWIDKGILNGEYVALRAHVGNTGLRPLVVSTVGTAAEHGGVNQFFGEIEFGPTKIDNPTFPIALQPGEFVTAGTHEVTVGSQVVVQIRKENWWRWVPGVKDQRDKTVKVGAPVAPL